MLDKIKSLLIRVLQWWVELFDDESPEPSKNPNDFIKTEDNEILKTEDNRRITK